MQTGVLETPVLLLNQNYEPLNICSVRRAIILMFNGRAELLENLDREIHSRSRTFPVPSVIRLVYMIKRTTYKHHVSRQEVFSRDAYTCQYCKSSDQELTLDHVIPRHQGGPRTWENVVAACVTCNHNKAGRTPSEAGLSLIRRPQAPHHNPYSIFQHRKPMDEWRKFLRWLP